MVDRVQPIKTAPLPAMPRGSVASLAAPAATAPSLGQDAWSRDAAQATTPARSVETTVPAGLSIDDAITQTQARLQTAPPAERPALAARLRQLQQQGAQVREVARAIDQARAGGLEAAAIAKAGEIASRMATAEPGEVFELRNQAVEALAPGEDAPLADALGKLADDRAALEQRISFLIEKLPTANGQTRSAAIDSLRRLEAERKDLTPVQNFLSDARLRGAAPGVSDRLADGVERFRRGGRTERPELKAELLSEAAPDSPGKAKLAPALTSLAGAQAGVQGRIDALNRQLATARPEDAAELQATLKQEQRLLGQLEVAERGLRRGLRRGTDEASAERLAALSSQVETADSTEFPKLRAQMAYLLAPEGPGRERMSAPLQRLAGATSGVDGRVQGLLVQLQTADPASAEKLRAQLQSEQALLRDLEGTFRGVEKALLRGHLDEATASRLQLLMAELATADATERPKLRAEIDGVLAERESTLA